MAGKSKYSDADLARVYVVLQANDGNVKRTARELNMVDSTVRKYRDLWEKEGPPRLEEIEAAVTDFVKDASSLRDLGVQALRGKLELLIANPKEVNVAAVTTLVGVLTDKIDRASGLNKPAGEQRALPSADDIRLALTGFITGMQALSESREQEIIDAEIVEPRGLPSGVA